MTQNCHLLYCKIHKGCCFTCHELHQSQLLLTDVFSRQLQASGQRHTRVSLRLSPRQDHTHLVHAEGSEGGGQQTRGAQDVPPVEEAEGNSFADAVDAETHQRQRGKELHTQRWPRGRVFLTHDEKRSLTLRDTHLRGKLAGWRKQCH